MKRKVGERAEVLIDTIDLEILRILEYTSYGVLELAEKLKIQHKNLKPHLEKLIKSELIITSKTTASTNKKDIGKISLFSPNLFPDDEKEYIKMQENHKVFLSFLWKIKNRNYESQTIRELSKELDKGKLPFLVKDAKKSLKKKNPKKRTN